MLLVIIGLLLVATVPLFGGHLSRLAEVRLHRAWLLAIALGLQIFAISIVPTWPTLPLVAMHLLSYVLAGYFVYINRTIPGIWIIAAGGALNGVTIALNGGTLPASPTALRIAGITPAAGHFNNSAIVAHPILPWFGDVFAVPASWPLSNVFSVGDVLIILGAVWATQIICGGPLARLVHRPEAGHHARTDVSSVADDAVAASAADIPSQGTSDVDRPIEA